MCTVSLSVDVSVSSGRPYISVCCEPVLEAGDVFYICPFSPSFSFSRVSVCLFLLVEDRS